MYRTTAARPGVDLRAPASFVERADERAKLAAAIADLAAVSGGLVLCRGEAGIGKSWLLDAASRRFAATGWQVLAARATDFDRRVPYALFGRFLDRADDGPPAGGAEILAELGHRLNAATEASASAVYSAANKLLARMRERAATLVIVDDLALADDDSIALLSMLLGRSAPFPLVVAGAVRYPGVTIDVTLSRLLSAADRENRLRIADVGPLRIDELGEMITGLLGFTPSPELADRVMRLSSGNLFLARQLVAGWDEADAFEVVDGRCCLRPDAELLSSDRRWTVLRGTLNHAAGTLEVAKAVAVLGSVTPERIGLVQRIAAVADDQAQRCFDALVANGILQADVHGAFAFSHQLIRDALVAEMGPIEQRRAHQHVIDWLQRQPRTPSTQLELAAHVAPIGEYGNDQHVDILTAAADSSCRAGPRSAIPWYNSAIALTTPRSPSFSALLSKSARAHFLSGQPKYAADLGLEALGRDDLGELRTRTATVTAEALNETGRSGEAIRVVDGEARAGSTSAHFLSLSANILGCAGRTAEAAALAARAEAVLDAASIQEQIVAAVHLAHAELVSGRYSALDAWSARLGALAEKAPATSQLCVQANIAYLQAVRGNTSAATAAIVRAQTLLSSTGWSLYRGELSVAQLYNLLSLGTWDTALTTAGPVADELIDAENYLHSGPILALMAEIHTNQGSWKLARQTLERNQDVHPAHATLQAWAQGGVELISGSPHAALAVMRPVLGQPVVDPASSFALLATRVAEAELALGNHGKARQALDMIPVDDSEIVIRAQLARLMVLAALGDDLARHDAERLADSTHLALERGRIKLLSAQLGVEPEANLRAAYKIFHRLGAQPWRRLTVDELRRLGLKIPRYRAPDDQLLSDVEAQMARLVQQARSNREIARAVSLSEKTVEHYLGRIYAKTGCVNRLELARALDQGLLDERSALSGRRSRPERAEPPAEFRGRRISEVNSAARRARLRRSRPCGASA
jgi:DNA-binding CsgD family transcriptional regulator